MSIKIYQVGGSVRDRFLGLIEKDIDFAVEASSFDAMHEYVQSICKQIYLVKPEYFTIRALHPTMGAVDFVLCRKDGIYSDHRRPDSVEPGTIYDDLARRDFTINAMAIDEDNNLIDPFNGLLDLKAKTLKCVGSTEDRLTEDPLRILRAMRFSITKDMKLFPYLELVFDSPELWIPTLDTISKDRIREELYKCFSFSTPATLSFLLKYPEEWCNYLFKDIWLKPTFEKV